MGEASNRFCFFDFVGDLHDQLFLVGMRHGDRQTVGYTISLVACKDSLLLLFV